MCVKAFDFGIHIILKHVLGQHQFIQLPEIRVNMGGSGCLMCQPELHVNMLRISSYFMHQRKNTSPD